MMLLVPAEVYTTLLLLHRQRRLFCPSCGGGPPHSLRAGLCPPCYRRARHSARSFAGLRDAVLTRDHFRCQVCAAGQQPVVHHRQPGRHALSALVTLCPACHAVVHKLATHRRWLPDPLATLWHEQHPGVPLQLQLEMRSADNEAALVAAESAALPGRLT